MAEFASMTLQTTATSQSSSFAAGLPRASSFALSTRKQEPTSHASCWHEACRQVVSVTARWFRILGFRTFMAGDLQQLPDGARRRQRPLRAMPRYKMALALAHAPAIPASRRRRQAAEARTRSPAQPLPEGAKPPARASPCPDTGLKKYGQRYAPTSAAIRRRLRP